MKTTLKTLLLTALIALLGVGLGLVWNLFNPRGISLAGQPQEPGQDSTSPYEAIFDISRSMPMEDKVSLEVAFKHWWDGRVVFVDARSARDYEAMHVPGAYNIHDQNFARDFLNCAKPLRGTINLPEPEEEQFPEGYPILVYCNNQYCDEAKITLKLLKDLSFRNTRCMVTGLDSWAKAGRQDERYEVAMIVNGHPVSRKGKDIPQLRDTGIAWLSPGFLLALLLALPGVVLGLLALFARTKNAVVTSGLAALGLCLRLGLGALFLYASYFKLVDPPGFAQMVACYNLIPETLVPLFTVCLPAVEALAGTLLVLGIGTRPATLVLLLGLWVFIAAIYTLLIRNMNCVCGCFPGEYHVSWMRILEDVAFVFAGLTAFWQGDRWLALGKVISRRKASTGK